MQRKQIQPEDSHPTGGYTHGILTHSGLMFISGQVSKDPSDMNVGEGDISLGENTYSLMLNWCPGIMFVFSLIGVWGAWVTYTLQSYKYAQIGAFFSILAMGFLVIGPILGFIALVLLPKI